MFSHDSLGRLVFHDRDGRQHTGVVAVRGFPISEPDYGISICDADSRELLWIDRLSQLSDADRKVIQMELADREFTPVLERIIRISMNAEPCEWEVDTDRGRTTFVLKTDEDVRRIDARRAMVTDSNGVSYLIRDLDALNATSRRYLERYL